MKGYFFAGSGALARFILRRDRLRILIWTLGFGGFLVGMVPVFENIILTGDENIVMAEMMKGPAMVAMVGPVYGSDNYTTGAAYANMMLLITLIVVGVMNISMVTRHTRQDEELGRLEVIRSLPVGRFSNLAATLIAALVSNFLLFLVTGIGFYAVRVDGMSFSGCMLYGAAMFVVGIFFASTTALFCQITANNRTASGFSFLLLMIMYMIRAVGDMGTEALALISPLGLILRTENFVNNYWWPVWVILLISIVIALVSLWLAGIRDLGRGLIPEKPGRRHASWLLSGCGGLAVRLLRSSMIVWAVTIFIFAAMYGSVFGDLESFIGDNEMLKAIFATNNEFSLTEQFIGMLVSVMSMLGTLPILSFMQRVWGEEKQGYVEHIWGRAASRTELFLAYFIPSFVMSVVLQFLAAFGFWSAGSMVLDTIPPFGIFLQATFAYLPAIWVLLGITMVLIAYLPDKTSVSYIYLGYSLFSVYIGTIVGLPEWTKKITPFGHIPQIPVEEMNVRNLAVLTIIAAVLMILGFVGYQNRDIRTQ